MPAAAAMRTVEGASVHGNRPGQRSFCGKTSVLTDLGYQFPVVDYAASDHRIADNHYGVGAWSHHSVKTCKNFGHLIGEVRFG
jgi:hypothetical protein